MKLEKRTRGLERSGESNGQYPCPIFVLCTPRSGSTLFSRVLDAHNQIACPPEIELVRPLIELGVAFEAAFPGDPRRVETCARELGQAIAGHTYGAYAREHGKRRWASKTLNAALHPEVLLRTFPDAQFVCLYRSCTDTLASLFDAAHTGYGNYGLEPFVTRHIRNIFEGLAVFWVDRVEKICVFESSHGPRCHRVRYEDFVKERSTVLGDLFAFLNVPWDPACISSEVVFAQEKRFSGVGDYKIAYTRDFETSSIGRGRTVPIERISPEVRSQINELHAELGYASLDGDADQDSEYATIAGHAESANDCERRASGPRASVEIERILGSEVPARLSDARAHGTAEVQLVESLAIVFPARSDRWLLDFEAGRVERSEAKAAFTFIFDDEAFVALADRSYNVGTAIRDGKMRLGTERLPAESPIPPRLFAPYVDALMALLP